MHRARGTRQTRICAEMYIHFKLRMRESTKPKIVEPKSVNDASHDMTSNLLPLIRVIMHNVDLSSGPRSSGFQKL